MAGCEDRGRVVRDDLERERRARFCSHTDLLPPTLQIRVSESQEPDICEKCVNMSE